MSYKVNIGSVTLEVASSFYFWKSYLLPKRWWSPGRVHFRWLLPLIVSAPRRWWPSKKDGPNVCALCNENKWMEGPPNMWCYECAKLYRQLSGLIGSSAPTWWLSDLRRKVKDYYGAPKASGLTLDNESSTDTQSDTPRSFPQ
jgi:hypothetical protein